MSAFRGRYYHFAVHPNAMLRVRYSMNPYGSGVNSETSASKSMVCCSMNLHGSGREQTTVEET